MLLCANISALVSNVTKSCIFFSSSFKRAYSCCAQPKLTSRIFFLAQLHFLKHTFELEASPRPKNTAIIISLTFFSRVECSLRIVRSFLKNFVCSFHLPKPHRREEKETHKKKSFRQSRSLQPNPQVVSAQLGLSALNSWQLCRVHRRVVVGLSCCEASYIDSCV